MENIPTNPSLNTIDIDKNDKIQTVRYDCLLDHSGTTTQIIGKRHLERSAGPIILVHDVGEFIGLYEPLVAGLVSAGYNTYCYDLRGHGAKAKELGYIKNFEQLVSDLLQIVSWVRRKEEGRLPIILAKGVGAVITSYFYQLYGALCQGIIYCSPCFQLLNDLPTLTRLFIRTLAEFYPSAKLPKKAAPKFVCPLKIGGPKTSEDIRTTVIPYHELPPQLNLTAHFTDEILSAISKTSKANLLRIKCPAIFLCPEKDEICDYGKIHRIVTHAKLENIRFDFIKEAGHQFLIENIGFLQQTLDILLPWLNSLPTDKIAPKHREHSKKSEPSLSSTSGNIVYPTP